MISRDLAPARIRTDLRCANVSHASGPEQVVVDQLGLCERQQVPTRDHVGLDAEPVPSDPALEPDGKEAVVIAGHNTNVDGRPRLEVTYRLESDVGLGPTIRRAL